MSSTMAHDNQTTETAFVRTFWNRHMPPVPIGIMLAVSGWAAITVVDIKTDVAVLDTRMDRLEADIEEIKRG